MSRKMSDCERRLTAAVHAQTPGVLEHVRKEGRLPPSLGGGGREIGLRLLVERRGIDFELTAAEQLVFDAIGTSKDVPGGGAILVAAGTDCPGDSVRTRDLAAKLNSAVNKMLADPEKLKLEIRAKAKRENPDMTEEQLDAGMGLLKIIFGI